MQVYQILQQLESTTKRLEKLAILESQKDNTQLQRVLDAALNPYRQYFIKQVPDYTPTGVSDLDVFLDHLVDFENRSVTGNDAKERLSHLMSGLSAEDAEVARRIIIKDLRCGVQTSTVNAVWENLIPTYPCLLGQKQTEKSMAKIKFPCILQLKEDGMRANVIYDKGSITIRGRSGKPIDLHGELDASFKGMEGMVFDGELVVVDENGKQLDRRTGNGILNKAIKGTITSEEASRVRYYIWDVIPAIDFYNYRCEIEYHHRLEMATTLVQNSISMQEQGKCFMIDSRTAANMDEVNEYFNEAQAKGHEGCMLKNIDHLWEDKRSPDLVKMKAEIDCDLKVIGWNPGTPGTKNEGKMGSLICASDDGKVEVSISGFSDELRDEITENIDSWIGRIVTVLYNERIKSKEKGREDIDSLFLPRFVELREDKDVADRSEDIK